MSGAFSPLRPLARYADFKGRSPRSEFWAFFLLIWHIYAGLYSWALYPLIPVFHGQPPGDGVTSHVLISVGFIMLLGFVLLLPTLAVQVRRLHDSNRTGWWVLLPMAVSMAGQHLVYIFQAEAVTAATLKAGEALAIGSGFDVRTIWEANWPLYKIILPWSLGPSLLAYAVLLTFYLWPGSKGSNRFGPNPRVKPST